MRRASKGRASSAGAYEEIRRPFLTIEDVRIANNDLKDSDTKTVDGYQQPQFLYLLIKNYNTRGD